MLMAIDLRVKAALFQMQSESRSRIQSSKSALSRDNGKLGMLNDPYHFTARKRIVRWTKVVGASDEIWFLAGACNPACATPLSAYCLGCDTNANRVIMLIRFDHYVLRGQNLHPRGPPKHPLVTHEEGTLLHIKYATPRPWHFVSAKMQHVLMSEFFSREILLK